MTESLWSSSSKSRSNKEKRPLKVLPVKLPIPTWPERMSAKYQ